METSEITKGRIKIVNQIQKLYLDSLKLSDIQNLLSDLLFIVQNSDNEDSLLRKEVLNLYKIVNDKSDSNKELLKIITDKDKHITELNIKINSLISERLENKNDK